jgi:hypothetical protein
MAKTKIKELVDRAVERLKEILFPTPTPAPVPVPVRR